MAQAPLKSTKSATGTGAKKNGKTVTKSKLGGTKKGGRVVKPKKKNLIGETGLIKKHSAGLTALTERTLGARVGHLELLGGGKREGRIGGGGRRGGDGKVKGVRKVEEVKKGGTKKFG